MSDEEPKKTRRSRGKSNRPLGSMARTRMDWNVFPTNQGDVRHPLPDDAPEFVIPLEPTKELRIRRRLMEAPLHVVRDNQALLAYLRIKAKNEGDYPTWETPFIT